MGVVLFWPWHSCNSYLSGQTLSIQPCAKVVPPVHLLRSNLWCPFGSLGCELRESAHSIPRSPNLNSFKLCKLRPERLGSLGSFIQLTLLGKNAGHFKTEPAGDPRHPVQPSAHLQELDVSGASSSHIAQCCTDHGAVLVNLHPHIHSRGRHRHIHDQQGRSGVISRLEGEVIRILTATTTYTRCRTTKMRITQVSLGMLGLPFLKYWFPPLNNTAQKITEIQFWQVYSV